MGLLFTSVGVIAGSFTPSPDSPDSSFFTLSDIRNKITDPDYSYSEHSFSPVTLPASTFTTLTEIWDAISWKTLNNSGTVEAGFYATTSLDIVEPNLLSANIASGTSVFGVEGSCEIAEGSHSESGEVLTIDLGAFFPTINTPLCPNPDIVRSTTVGPFSYDVDIYAKTNISIDDYLRINGNVIESTGLNGYCGDNRFSLTSATAGTKILTVLANTPILIENVDTVGVRASGSGTLSFVRN